MRAGRCHQTAACSAAVKEPSASPSPGFIKKAKTEPMSSSPMLPRNGNSQFPVLSITYPETRGEMIAASADPLFIRPLAEPEKRGAMSMGIAHMGPIVNSAKKKAKLRQRAAEVTLCKNKIGAMKISDPRNQK